MPRGRAQTSRGHQQRCFRAVRSRGKMEILPPKMRFDITALHVRRPALPAEGGARGRRAPLVVHDGALRAQPSTTFSLPPFPSPADVRDMTNLERRLIDDDGAAPASHYSTIASHRDLRRCHDGGTARPRSPRARPTSSLRERPGRVRSCSSSPLDLTSGGPARGLHAPPGPNGPLQGRHVPPALLPPRRPLTPACRFPLPSAHKELQSTRDT